MVSSDPVPTLPILPFGKLALGDLLGQAHSCGPADVHLREAIAWLCRAQDQGSDDGVSYGYSVRGGWLPSYVETTGYIAVTFFNLAKHLARPELRERALRMADWLLTVQLPDGSFGNVRMAVDQGIVFDTGQDLFGLVRAARETGDVRFSEAAARAGHWLTQVSDHQDRWTRYTHLGVPHVYNSRVAWALLQLHKDQPTEAFERVARANLDWAVSEQQESGLYAQCAFQPGQAPFTHTIAYAMRGLWEAGELLDDESYRKSVLRAADALVPLVAHSGFIPGQVDEAGRAAARYCCVTGNAQLAIVWAKMFKRRGDERHKHCALRALRYAMALQDVETLNDARRGALKGSHPTWGRYSPLTYPNWATKFFIDALVECQELGLA